MTRQAASFAKGSMALSLRASGARALFHNEASGRVGDLVGSCDLDISVVIQGIVMTICSSVDSSGTSFWFPAGSPLN